MIEVPRGRQDHLIALVTQARDRGRKSLIAAGRDGDLVGCGINQLTMARQADDWRIVFGMDTNAPITSCDTFKEGYLARRDQGAQFSDH